MPAQGTSHTSKGRAGPDSIYRQETRLLWLERAAVFDLALFCFSLQLSAVFGHSPVSPAIFQLSFSKAGWGQPSSSSAVINLALRAGGAPSPGCCSGLRGGTDGSPLRQRSRQARGACPTPARSPLNSFGRDAANSNCNFHSGGCALQAK